MMDAHEDERHAHSHSHGDHGGHGHSHGNGHSHSHGEAQRKQSCGSDGESKAVGNGHSHSHGHAHSHEGGKSRHNHGHGSAATPLLAAHSHGSKEEGSEDASKRKARCQLQTAIVFCFMFMCAEVVGGYFANSLAIMTDAAHLLSDVAGLLINVFALWLSSKPPTSNLTYGYHRVEVLGALASVLLIWLLTGVLVYEAVLRILHPVAVKGRIMFIVACAGFCVNLALMKVLHQGGHGHSHAGGGGHGHSHGGGHSHSHGGSGGGGHGHSHGLKDVGGDSDDEAADGAASGGCFQCCLPSGGNIGVRAAFIHAIGDLVQSIGVMLAGGLIWWKPEWHIADPICTFFFSILVLFTTVQIMNHGVRVLLDSVPSNVSQIDLLADLEAIQGVQEAHDVHIWSIGSGKPLMSAHLTVEADRPKILRNAQRICAKYGIVHTTIQIEVLGTRDVRHCETHKPCDMQALRRHVTGVEARVARTLSVESDSSHPHRQPHGADASYGSTHVAHTGNDNV